MRHADGDSDDTGEDVGEDDDSAELLEASDEVVGNANPGQSPAHERA